MANIDENFTDIITVKASSFPVNATSATGAGSSEISGPAAIDAARPNAAVPDAVTDSVDTQRKRSASIDEESDAAYLAKRMKRQITEAVASKDGESESNAEGQQSTSVSVPEAENASELATSASEEGDRDAARLFLRNLAYTVTQAELWQAFAKHGEVLEVCSLNH